jgi:formyltetrahydrofolate deformylase
MSVEQSEAVLLMRSPDRAGIVARVSSLLAEEGWDIREASVYGDPDTGEFFVRMRVLGNGEAASTPERVLLPLSRQLNIDVRCFDTASKPRVLIAVSRIDHCLNDLLHKWRIGTLPIEVVGVVSNHDTLRRTADWHDVPFYHLPITAQSKALQETAIEKILQEQNVELLVLARYMQILSDEFSRRLEGRCINIHHSFLPSFKGARPYHQAHARGVKLVGSTAHYVTPDLDEGPIIEQEVRRVSHATTPQEMIEIGREVEATVLSRAVKWHAERRVIMTGGRTIVLVP